MVVVSEVVVGVSVGVVLAELVEGIVDVVKLGLTDGDGVSDGDGDGTISLSNPFLLAITSQSNLPGL